MRAAIAALLLSACVAAPGGGDDGAPAPRECLDPAPGCVYGICDGGGLDESHCDECGGTMYQCNGDTGQWEVAFTCEPPPAFVEGNLTLAQSVSDRSAGCPAFEPRAELILTVVDGASKTLTVAPPTSLDTSLIVEGDGPAHLSVQLHDVWATTTPTLSYDLTANADGTIAGTASGSFDDCTFSLAISGTYP